MAELISLKNIGRNIEKRLQSVDISTAEDLKRVGSKEAFIRLTTCKQSRTYKTRS